MNLSTCPSVITPELQGFIGQAPGLKPIQELLPSQIYGYTGYLPYIIVETEVRFSARRSQVRNRWPFFKGGRF